ncbi:MAG: hypothetical protein AAF004_09670 [Pseudomonadota bacterium]
MLVGNAQIRSYALLGAGFIVALGLWIQGYFLGALLVLLVGGGIAMAKPEMQKGRVVCKGTPVVAMFAIMLASASGMTMAIDQVTEMFAPHVEVAQGCEHVALVQNHNAGSATTDVFVY